MTEHGRLIGGRYRLQEPLGSGGMADVHIARDEVLDRDVAIKVLRTRYLDDETFLERFRREARSAARLNHRHIVAVHDTGSDDGIPYIVMELVAGRSLDHVLAERGRMDVRPAVEILVQVCEALAYAHDNGVVHRDVKPGNILIIEGDATPTVKVTDFGIARAAGDDTITLTSVLGTAAYLSPEQAQGERADHRADLYAAGIVLYELLTGAPPYRDGTAVQVALRHVGGSPDPPSELVDGVAAHLDAIVLTALAKDPDDRYQTAEDLRRDLRALLAGEPVSVDRASALAAAAGPGGRARTLRLDDDTVAMGDVAALGAAGAADAPASSDTPAAGGVAATGEDARDERSGRRAAAVAALAALLLFALVALFASRDGGAPDEQPTPTSVETTERSPSPPPEPDDGEDADDGGDDGGGPPDDRGPPDDPGRDD